MTMLLPSAESVYVIDWNLLQVMPVDNDWFAGKVCLIPETVVLECLEKRNRPDLLRKFENWILHSSTNIFSARNIYELFEFQRVHNRRLHRDDLVDMLSTRAIRRARRDGILNLIGQAGTVRTGNRLVGMADMRISWVKSCEDFAS
jgi:hypothetical protein